MAVWHGMLVFRGRSARAALMHGIFAALAVLLISPQMALADNSCHTLKMNGAFDWYPVIMRPNDDGTAEGVFPRVAAEIARRMGITVEVQPITPFKRQLVQLENGELDLVLGAYWTKERAEAFNYTSSLLADEVAIFVRIDAQFPFAVWSDLKGRLGIRPFGGSYGEAFDAYAAENLTLTSVAPFPGEFRSNMLTMLLNGNADYAVLGRYHGLKMIEESRSAGEITDLSWPVVSNGVHILFSKTSPCHAVFPKFEKELLKLLEEGWIKIVLAQYGRPASTSERP